MVEPVLPEAGHLACPVDQRCQGAELRAVVRLTAFVAIADQAGPFQYAEMLGDGRLGNPGLSRQGADRLLAVAAQPLEEGPPGRIFERSEQKVVGIGHLQSITRQLLIDP